MNYLDPWINGDTAAQEQMGEKEGYQHASEGWCTDCCADNNINTPYMMGYNRGQDKFKASGLPIAPKPPLTDEERKARLKYLSEYCLKEQVCHWCGFSDAHPSTEPCPQDPAYQF